MKHRKQTQHWRRYKSGKITVVNRGLKYLLRHKFSVEVVSDGFPSSERIRSAILSALKRDGYTVESISIYKLGSLN